jgi:ParB-like chromosome segregation protein Spo0J
LDRLVAHPDNANVQSKANFGKLVRNIERSGRYEPLVVRPCPGRAGYYQIINGHHRRRALTELGYTAADCVVWDVDDEQVDILLATLNRLGGSDQLGKKLQLLERLNKRSGSRELARLLPQSKGQIERLTSLRMPSKPADIDAKYFAHPMVFFLDDRQQEVVEKALQLASRDSVEKTRAARRAGALVRLARFFAEQGAADSGGQ